MRESRALALFGHVQMALRHAAISQEDFADEVARIYMERTPLHVRGIEFHAHGRGVDPYQVRRDNAQLLFRMLKPGGPVRLPVEVEEAVVYALPQPFREECLRELCARYGLLPAPIPPSPDAAPAEQVRSPCTLMRQAAAAIERIAPMLEDGRIGPEDAPHFADALRAINAVMSTCVTLNEQIAQAMQQPDNARHVREFPMRAGRDV